jgi:hypothetical protein
MPRTIQLIEPCWGYSFSSSGSAAIAIASKRENSVYRYGRSPDWLKSRNPSIYRAAN